MRKEKKTKNVITRDKRGKVDKNKAGYPATPVACGWAGAIIEHLGRSSKAKNPINAEKVKCDGRTDRRTDGPTD